MQLKSLNDNKNVCFVRDWSGQEGSNKYNSSVKWTRLVKMLWVQNRKFLYFVFNTVTDPADYSLIINASNFNSVLFIQHQ